MANNKWMEDFSNFLNQKLKHKYIGMFVFVEKNSVQNQELIITKIFNVNNYRSAYL